VKGGWFTVVIRMLGVYSGVQEDVASAGRKTGGASVGRCRGQGPQQGRNLYGGRAKGMAGRVRYGLWLTVGRCGKEMCGLGVLD
jgi:hypothetical protein